MEITSSGVSVYEIVIDLQAWGDRRTNRTAGFNEALIRVLPTTALHKCMSGKEGGFHSELIGGTNFAHVVEHVLLELIHLAEPEGRVFTGWTKDLGDGSYKIHYGAPDFLTGRLAPILAIDLVSRLLQGEDPDLDGYLAELRDPLAYFARVEGTEGVADRSGCLQLMRQMDAPLGDPTEEVPPSLSDWQKENLSGLLDLPLDLWRRIGDQWRRAFAGFGGDFARGITDKIEVVHPDRFRPQIQARDFAAYFQTVANLGQMLRSLRIPLIFATHAIWLYKNILLLSLLERQSGGHEERVGAIWDVDILYQNILHALLEGYCRTDSPQAPQEKAEVRGFKARQVRPAKVLIVDDDPMTRRVVRDLLEFRGVETIEARDGLQALRLMAENRFGIAAVLLDLVLPGMDGKVICRRLKDGYAQTRILLTSGYPCDDETAELLAEHEVSFLKKPFTSVQLMEKLGELLELDQVNNQRAAD